MRFVDRRSARRERNQMTTLFPVTTMATMTRA
jgi:hypothetical protein